MHVCMSAQRVYGCSIQILRTYFHKTCICFLQIEISSENAEDVINNLTMNVELADKADQIAINFAVITEVIMVQAQTTPLVSSVARCTNYL